MKYQKYVPEGWFIENKAIGEVELNKAIQTQEIMEAKVTNCDDNFNLYVNFGDNKVGIISFTMCFLVSSPFLSRVNISE
jgi:hypothetical protein